MAAVRDRDLGYRRIMRNLAGMGRVSGFAGGPGVLVGVRANAGAAPDGTSLMLIASVNEFGSSDGHVPERSFLRSTIDEQQTKYLKMLSDATGRAVDQGVAAWRTQLGRVGAVAVGDVQRKITAIDTPPNAPSTIAAKGADNPLIDTGRLRQSIDFEVVGI